MSENVKLMKYQAKDGQEISLTPDIVRKYLVRGKSNLVTSQEIMFFWSICKSRGLNPQAGDCYLIKYSDDPAQIITSIGFLRSRARANKNYRGHEKGVIVLDKDGKVKRTKGLVLPDEILIGGWFEAIPDGDLVPTELEVNLEGYIKKTAKGVITKFWKKENQATMIAKVAESQGLRTAWPDEFGQMYTQEEINTELQGPIIDVSHEEITAFDENEFYSKLPKDINKLHMRMFIQKTAAIRGDVIEIPMREALKDLNAFISVFQKWEKAEFSKEEMENKSESISGLPDLLNEKTWHRLQSKYSTFIHSNLAELKNLSVENPEIIEKMKSKWECKFVNVPWPLGNNVNQGVSEEDKQQDNANMFNIPKGTKPDVHLANLINDATTQAELEAIMGDSNSMLSHGVITKNAHDGLQTIMSACIDKIMIEKPF